MGERMLGQLSVETFLKDYWQKKPVVLKGAFPEVSNLIEKDELGGLALENFVESRLISDTGNNDYKLHHGPFKEKDLLKLPPKRWTLVVQAVDQYIPDASLFLDNFNFIPNWRVDDLMVSYAEDMGSVGPHFDHYDVFLIQGMGKRTWQIGETCTGEEALLDNPKLKILADMQVTERFELVEGDVLYLPPMIPHHGVSIGESMSFSVGFRSLSDVELLSEFSSYLEDENHNATYYQDHQLNLSDDPGLLSSQAIEKTQNMLLALCNSTEKLTAFLAKNHSTPKYADSVFEQENPLSQDKFEQRIKSKEPLYRDESARFVYTGDDCPKVLYIAGVGYQVPLNGASLCKSLCAYRKIKLSQDKIDSMSPEHWEWLTKLYNLGYFYFD